MNFYGGTVALSPVMRSTIIPILHSSFQQSLFSTLSLSSACKAKGSLSASHRHRCRWPSCSPHCGSSLGAKVQGLGKKWRGPAMETWPCMFSRHLARTSAVGSEGSAPAIVAAHLYSEARQNLHRGIGGKVTVKGLVN